MTRESLEFSVLMSLYQGTRAEEFTACLDSISGQSRLPTELVAVFDGPVAESVKQCLDVFDAQHPIRVKRLDFSDNRGLGPALADGLLSCSHQLVARVDSDDVNLPHRFHLQLNCFAEHKDLDVLGGWMAEVPGPGHRGQPPHVRRVPLTGQDVADNALYRNPINHPTVMFRRNRVLEAGNYSAMLWFEDYFLWARMMLRGCQFMNLGEVLVHARADMGYFSRRGGLAYLKREYQLAAAFRKIGFHSLLQSARFLATRTIFRIVPVTTRERLYSRFLRTG